MDSRSSSTSSVASAGPEVELEEAAERPLSPVLSKSKINRKLMCRKASERKIKGKVNDEGSQEQYGTKINVIDVYEAQRKQFYDLLCENDEEHNIFCGTANEHPLTTLTPIPSEIRNDSREERRDGILGCSLDGNSKIARFCTAEGQKVEISEETLMKNREIFRDIIDDNNINHCSLFKNPLSVKKTLLKSIPSSSSQKNFITYEEIKINIRNNSDKSNDDSNPEYSDNMNKIFGNKKFVEFSTSSAENTTMCDTLIEVADYFNPNKEPKIPSYQTYVEEDWNDTKQKETELEVKKEILKKIALERSAQKHREKGHIKINKKNPFMDDDRSEETLTTIEEENLSKKSLIEIHRNTNFRTKDSDQHFGLPEEQIHISPEERSTNFFGFSSEEQQQAIETAMKTKEAIVETERKVDKAEEKSSKKESSRKSKRGKSKKRDEKKPDVDKVETDNNQMKRKVINETNCLQSIRNETENQTIELSPNHKKFKIEIDCNSKFRINISCNGNVEDSKPLDSLNNVPSSSQNEPSPAINISEKPSQSTSNEINDFEAQQPKGKLIQKFIDKAQKFYREMRNSDLSIGEKSPVETNESIDNPGFKIQQKPKLNKKWKEGSEPNYEDISEPVKECIEISGFKTCSNKEVKVSEKGVKEAKKKYESSSKRLSEETLRLEGNKGEVAKATEKDFKKSKKMCEVTSEKQDEEDTKEVIKDSKERKIDKSPKNTTNITNKNLINHPESTVTNCGFNTAGGAKVTLPEKKLENARKMYNNAHEKQDVEKTKPSKQMNEKNETLHANVGFQTATGRNIKCSKEMFSKAERMYESYESSEQSDERYTKQKKTESPTTKRNPVLHKNKIDYSGNNSDNQNNDCKIINVGFKSAAGKNVKCSKEYLSKAERMYETCESSEQSDEKHTKEKKIDSPINKRSDQEQPVSFKNNNNNFNTCGFTTGSGKKCTIPEKKIQTAKQLYEPIEEPTKIEKASTTKNLFDDISLQAGDFDTKPSEKKPDDTMTTSDLSRGDFISNSENKELAPKPSKKAFELLEDVVETVDCALQNIDERLKTPQSAGSRKRLGRMKINPIMISDEKFERAKKFFIGELNCSDVEKSVGISQVVCSTPVLNKRVVTFGNDGDVPKTNHIPPGTVTTTNNLDSSILFRDKTSGNIDSWFDQIDEKVESVKMELKELEEKKSYLIYQKSVLEKRKTDVISPQPGILIRSKDHIKVQLKDLKTNNSPENISEFILGITPRNAGNVHFKFKRASNNCLNFYTTLDGALVVPNIDNVVGFSEIETAFEAMPGVDANLIPANWLENHYKLIVWKLAGYERFLSDRLAGCLTVENVVQQLKYRYDREIDRAERPALRKIFEADDIPQKRMVLCVSAIENSGRNEIELTDGWYCVRTVIDEGLRSEVEKAKIRVGTKLITAGAHILNCDGQEASSSVKLKIFYNSTRRAPWHSKLGYQRCPGPLLIPLHSIRPDGGIIGCIKAYVARVYPLRFMEQVNDKRIWRNCRAEERRVREFEHERLAKMEKVHLEVQKKYELQKMQQRKNALAGISKFTKSELLRIESPETLLSILESSSDPEAVMEYLSSSQTASVLQYRQDVCMQIQHEITNQVAEEMEKLKLAKRKVVAILKLLIVDATTEAEKAYQFCLWNPTEDALSLLKESNVYYIYNIIPRFNGELFSTNKTFFKLNKKISRNKFNRQPYPIGMLFDKHYRPSFNEFDVVGLMVYQSVTDVEQNVWLADYLGNLLFIKVRDGPKFCRLLDDVSRGDVISAQNLLYCPPEPEFAVAMANQFTVVTKSMQNYMTECTEMFKLQLPKDLTKFLGDCDRKIEKHMRVTVGQPKEGNDTQFLQCGLKLPPNWNGFCDDSSEDGTTIPRELTAMDVAMSLIDTDQFG